ncbi:putative ATP synthase subunit s, mitochondrial [Hypsibius exemplaris]|uniref:ATP synthase subunit s, mitochondrial n=1 Tax=Hypsibius exemplaris TaxID=2072580 RepID=A0A1W0X0G7_HYPEX|nr:putative ATP synthase subunit s, mitochondrial [Hypsibius exemplaris]
MATICLRKSCSVAVATGFRQRQIMANMQIKRTAFAFLDAAWNRIDANRIKEVGPEKAAAEWLMRCGAAVKWRGQNKFMADYNAMELTSGADMKIEGINAAESCIMASGFDYLKGLSAVRQVKFNKTHHIDDLALKKLSLLQDTLEDLEVVSCGNVTDIGIKGLGELRKLKTVHLADLIGVKKPEECVKSLKAALPQCQIQFDGKAK